ncbi:hypothetical protein BDW02DRAFT_507663 [Decorospora gaudefroyi]|uniref:GPI anchored protein n=1 Tax=Decorospora gaudefroyi TaxID=184978 RepID=A0A6A5K242_9PLEO|nr:hypothetical protein BDW02DRAFT_507663 [Decorospora gaudefroyi]
MRQSIAILSILASSACAEDIISVYFPGGYEGVDPVATINTVNPSTTEFRVACPTGVDSSECGWSPGLDVTILSQTRYQAEMTAEGISMSLGCDYNEKAVEMSCTVNQVGGNDDTGGEPVTAVLSGTDVEFLAVTVVQGNSLLTDGTSVVPSASAVAESTAPVSSARSASTGLMTASVTAPTASMTLDSETSPTVSGSASTPAFTGAAVHHGVQGSALLALVGAAALNIW